MTESTPHAESFVEIEQGKRPYIPKFCKNFQLFFGGGKAYAPTHAPILAKFGMEEWTFGV